MKFSSEKHSYSQHCGWPKKRHWISKTTILGIVAQSNFIHSNLALSSRELAVTAVTARGAPKYYQARYARENKAVLLIVIQWMHKYLLWQNMRSNFSSVNICDICLSERFILNTFTHANAQGFCNLIFLDYLFYWTALLPRNNLQFHDNPLITMIFREVVSRGESRSFRMLLDVRSLSTNPFSAALGSHIFLMTAAVVGFTAGQWPRRNSVHLTSKQRCVWIEQHDIWLG